MYGALFGTFLLESVRGLGHCSELLEILASYVKASFVLPSFCMVLHSITMFPFAVHCCNASLFWQGVNNALERAFNLYKNNPDIWKQFVQKDMNIDFSWDSSAAHYEELYSKSVARARAAIQT